MARRLSSVHQMTPWEIIATLAQPMSFRTRAAVGEKKRNFQPATGTGMTILTLQLPCPLTVQQRPSVRPATNIPTVTTRVHCTSFLMKTETGPKKQNSLLKRRIQEVLASHSQPRRMDQRSLWVHQVARIQTAMQRVQSMCFQRPTTVGPNKPSSQRQMGTTTMYLGRPSLPRTMLRFLLSVIDGTTQELRTRGQHTSFQAQMERGHSRRS